MKCCDIFELSSLANPLQDCSIGILACRLTRRARPTHACLKVSSLFCCFSASALASLRKPALEQTQLTVRTPYLDNDFVRTVFRGPMSATLNNDLRVRLIGDGSAALQQILTDRGFGGRPGRFSALASRYLLEFGFKAEYAYDYGMPQWLARLDHTFSYLHLERLFLGRHKLFHYRVWYRDILRDYLREMLLDPRTLSRPYIERKRLEGIVRDHVTGSRNYTTEIHKVLSLELVHRLFLDRDDHTHPAQRLRET